MPKDDRKHNIDYLVEEYMNYNISNDKTIKECEVRFGTKKQIHISKSLFHLKERLLKKFNLNNYSKTDEKTIFFGLYQEEDFDLIKNHKGKRYVIPGGSDLPNVTKVEKDEVISISKNIRERLFVLGINSVLVDFNIVDRNIFKPIFS